MPKISIMLAGLLLTLSSVQAEVISIADPRYDVPNSTGGVLRPTQGMDMNKVEQTFGVPEAKFPAVGDPPCCERSFARTSWPQPPDPKGR